MSIVLTSVALAGWPGWAPMQTLAVIPPSRGLYAVDKTDAAMVASGVPPIAIDHRSRPKPAPITDTEAVAAYFGEMMELLPGETVLWPEIYADYVARSEAEGWPALSGKTLSRILVRLGCIRGKRDMRRQGKGRVVTITFPLGDIGP